MKLLKLYVVSRDTYKFVTSDQSAHSIRCIYIRHNFFKRFLQPFNWRMLRPLILLLVHDHGTNLYVSLETTISVVS